ncbi:MAG: SRPBCC family protein [Putridiphycobacter sp.]
MALQIKTEIKIEATAERVWEILTHFEDYPNWNPFIKSLTGNVKVGEQIKVIIHPPESKPMTFKPKVLAYIPQKQLTWLGHFGFPGIFDGQHQFEIVTHEDGCVTFIHSETFKGLLVPLLKKQLNLNTKNGFIEMNKKLKQMAEK